MITFNLNNYIYVEITDIGWKHLQDTVRPEYIEHCIDPYKRIIDEKVYYKLQAHRVMQLFGNGFQGSVGPINSNILVEMHQEN
jgi:hypothetical protein